MGEIARDEKIQSLEDLNTSNLNVIDELRRKNSEQQEMLKLSEEKQDLLK